MSNKLKELRSLMIKNSVDAYLIPNSDPHQSEYLADFFKEIKWLTGFSGSNATVVVTKEKAVLWTDGRYFIQAENELKDTEFELYKEGIEGFPSVEQFLFNNLRENEALGLNGKTISCSEFYKIKNILDSKNIKYITNIDLISELWNDRPDFPDSKLFLYDLKYSGKSSKEKLRDIRKTIKKLNSDCHVISSLDDINWIFNIRGNDIPCNPLIMTYAYIDQNNAILFIKEGKIEKSDKKYLENNGIIIKDYENIDSYLENKENLNILIDKEKTNKWIYDSISKKNTIIDKTNPSYVMKAQKNKVEVENLKNAYIKDSVALTKFLYWLENKKHNGLTEYKAAKKLLEFRKEQEDFIEPSFLTIMAFKENGPMMHYRPQPEDSEIIEGDRLLLIDSGGQYLDGTTDITRTIPIGNLSNLEKKDYTLTLKSHINLASAKFLHGTSGHVLDAIARKPMWDNNLDYKSGTGHGVGYFLSVHEGPQRFHNTIPNNVPLEENMLISVEPGVYRDNKHGIRIENVVIVKNHVKNEFGTFMKFEPLNYVYIETDALLIDNLNEFEKNWLNNYHQKVFEEISPYLSEKEKSWLKEKTTKI